jgi:uncharacterized protein (UPF0261 family)
MQTEDRAIAVVGTFDSKGPEHLLLKKCIERRGLRALTINVGTKAPSPFPADIDLFSEVIRQPGHGNWSRDEAIDAVLSRAKAVIRRLHERGSILGIISAGGGTGTHLATAIMRVLPMGVPKVMVSTVASRNMAQIVGTKDITMIHSVVDLLGVNSISGGVLFRAAGAVCGMVLSRWRPKVRKKRVALTMFGFITEGAENAKRALEEIGYEVIAFHANGTGGMAMEEMARDGFFDAILDLATHELADELKNGYCAGIGPERLQPVEGQRIPRLVVPGGLDCAVLEFTRQNIPEEYKGRKIFFYDFRSAVRLDLGETRFIAGQLADRLNLDPPGAKVLVPIRGWSEADRADGPLYDPQMRDAFLERLKSGLDPEIEVREVDLHINDSTFARVASTLMDQMIQENAA